MSVVAAMHVDAQLARLSVGLTQLGLDVPEEQQRQLLSYVHKLAKWNAVYNLTAVHAIDDMLVVHLLDSLSIVPLIDASGASRVLDVGSGAGLPGIPLALVRPSIRVTTVDAVAKKISFQQQMNSELRIDNLTALHVRVEALTLDKKPDLIVSRAYTALPDMLDSIATLVDPQVTVIAMKGIEPTQEMADIRDPWTVVEVRRLIVPFLGAQRCAVVIRRNDSESAA